MGCGHSSTYKSTSRSPSPSPSPIPKPSENGSSDTLRAHTKLDTGALNGSTSDAQRSGQIHNQLDTPAQNGHTSDDLRTPEQSQLDIVSAPSSKTRSSPITVQDSGNFSNSSDGFSTCGDQTSEIESELQYLKNCESYDTDESYRVIASLLGRIKADARQRTNTSNGNVPAERTVVVAEFVSVFIKVIRWFKGYVTNRPQTPDTPDPHEHLESQQTSHDQDDMSVNDEISQEFQNKEQENVMNMKRACITLLSSYDVDDNETVRTELIQEGGIELLCTELDLLRVEKRNKDDQSQILFTLFILRYFIYTGHSRDEENTGAREAVREANGVEVLTRFLESESEDNPVKTLSDILLCFIVDDAEADELVNNSDAIYLLITALEYAIESSDRKVHFYVTKDFYFFDMLAILDCLYKLADNDSCKKEIVMNRGASVLVRILQEGFTDDTDELQVTIDILWKLTFGGGIDCKGIVRKKLVKNDCVQVLLRLRTSAPSRSLRVSATCLLWRSGIADLNKAMLESRSFDFAKENYVYLSHQECNMPSIYVKDALFRAGYKVCESHAELDGHKVSSMMNNIRKSAVVVLCASTKYQDDLICRTEATYAHELQKTIEGFIMEKNYKPDGWLGKLLKQRKTYNMYSEELMRKYNPDQIMGELVIQT